MTSVKGLRCLQVEQVFAGGEHMFTGGEHVCWQ